MVFFSWNEARTWCLGPLLMAAFGVALAEGEPAAESPPAAMASAAPGRVPAHMGVVTCAGSTCHGATAPDPKSKVMLNEFVIWQKQDKHATAYKVLTNEQSARIARNLGLADATKAKICLDCHTDNVPETQRGNRFQISDGVGCEACHGGAENYLGPHATGRNSRQQNLDAGLYPTEAPESRGKLCLTCHLGTNDAFLSHKIYGAGHPRVSFELDTFTAIQPAHYRVDEDYRKRKQVPQGVKVWAVGQLMAVEQNLTFMGSPDHQGNGPWPELAFYDCHGCHHPMNTRKFNSRDVTAGLEPGTIRVNDSGFLMLAAIADRVAPELADQYKQGIQSLHKASAQDRSAMQRAVAALKSQTERLRASIAGHEFTQDEMYAILRDMVSQGLQREYNDYVAAEQVVMAVDSITNTLQASTLRSGMEDLYKSTKSQDRFKPEAFQAALEGLSKKIGR